MNIQIITGMQPGPYSYNDVNPAYKNTKNGRECATYLIINFQRASLERFLPVKNLVNRFTKSLRLFLKDIIAGKIVPKKNHPLYSYYYALTNENRPDNLYGIIDVILRDLEEGYEQFVIDSDFKVEFKEHPMFGETQCIHNSIGENFTLSYVRAPLDDCNRETVLITALLSLYYFTCCAIESRIDYNEVNRLNIKLSSGDVIARFGYIEPHISSYIIYEQNCNDVMNLAKKEQEAFTFFTRNAPICPYTGNFLYFILDPDVYINTFQYSVFDKDRYVPDIGCNSYKRMLTNVKTSGNLVGNIGSYEKTITAFREAVINYIKTNPKELFSINTRVLYKNSGISISYDDFINAFFPNGILDFPNNAFIDPIARNSSFIYDELYTPANIYKDDIPYSDLATQYYEKTIKKVTKKRPVRTVSGRVPMDEKFIKQLVDKGLSL